MKTIDYLRELLKKKEIVEEDKEKIENLKFLLSNDDIFFNLDLETAVGILDYLGVEEDKIKPLYLELISPKNYLETSKPYVSISRQ